MTISTPTTAQPTWTNIAAPDDPEVFSAFAERPTRDELQRALAVLHDFSARNPRESFVLEASSLSAAIVEQGWERRTELVSPETATCGGLDLSNHVAIIDDMAHLRDALYLNWIATVHYARRGAVHLIGGNVLYVPRSELG